MNENINYRRLSYLGERIKSGLATQEERDEYMKILYQNKSITSQQYNEYLSNKNKKNTDELINAALAIGAVILLGYLISQIVKE